MFACARACVYVWVRMGLTDILRIENGSNGPIPLMIKHSTGEGCHSDVEVPVESHNVVTSHLVLRTFTGRPVECYKPVKCIYGMCLRSDRITWIDRRCLRTGRVKFDSQSEWFEVEIMIETGRVKFGNWLTTKRSSWRTSFYIGELVGSSAEYTCAAGPIQD